MTRAIFAGALGCLLAAAPAHAADPFLRRTATVEAVQKVGPAVVNITTERVVENQGPFRAFGADPFDQFFNDFFEPRAPRTVQSLGSGVLIDAERHILTNEHVIRRASRIRVTLADGREFGASLVGSDPTNDLAVLKVDSAEKLPYTEPGSSNDLMVGEPVIAIGNPFGLSNTVTTGVISAVDRSIRAEQTVFHGFLQTDASINPGNSGGPLLNAEGHLIGVNTAIYGGAQGIGFAIPIDVAKRVVQELIAHGELTPVWLGLDVQDVDARLEDALHLPDNVNGVLVSGVQPNSPASRAGVTRGELITKFGGRPLRTARDFYEMLGAVTVGEDVRIDLWREGATRSVSAHAVELPESAVGDLCEQLLGMKLAARHEGGFVVQNIRSGSAAAQIGIQKGDLLVGINGRPLADASALRRAVLDLRGRPQALLMVQRGPGRYRVTVPLA